MTIKTESIAELIRNREKPQLVHTARQMFDARWAKYNDPANLEWDFKDVLDKWERHAWSAYLDLVAVEKERDYLLSFLQQPTQTTKSSEASNSPDDTPASSLQPLPKSSSSPIPTTEGEAVELLSCDWHSPSGKLWHEWFDRVGEHATVDVINATANLVIAERDIATRAVNSPAVPEPERIKKIREQRRKAEVGPFTGHHNIGDLKNIDYLLAHCSPSIDHQVVTTPSSKNP